nr:EOG090X0H1B [Polyphemus pediculus]
MTMPSKKKKYNARFPPARIKKIMQTDEEVGKVAAAVPVIISRALELFVESLLTKAVEITSARNAKTLSPAHLKQCILAENRFDFLKDLVLSIPDVQGESEEGGTVNVPATPTVQHPPIFRSHSSGEATTGSSSLPKRGGGTGRPRGRPRKSVSLQSPNSSGPRLWSSVSRKSATESDDSESGDSDGSEEEEDLSTDTDSLPKGTKNAPANGNKAMTSPSSVQFNAVQPNFYQEINNTQPHLQIQITIPPLDPHKVDNGLNPECPANDDEDYDT